MSLKNDAQAIINMLQAGEFYAQCPCCDEPMALNRAGLFYLNDFTPEGSELYDSLLSQIEERRAALKQRRVSISERSQITAKAVNLGCILERLAPSMGGFPFECGDCRSLFDPIDYVIFRGLTSRNRVDHLVFVDIKTGGAKLSPCQKEIRSLVNHGKVEWGIYNPEATR